MKVLFLLVCLHIFTVAMAAGPSQLVLNVERQDFKPLQDVSWRIMAGSTSFTQNEDDSSFSGTGLSVGIEKMLTQKWSTGLQFANVSGIRSKSGLFEYSEYRENRALLNGYVKYAFVNFPINQWNLVQVNLLGGASVYEHESNVIQPIYGASVSYNYDNLIGFELGTKINFRAQAVTGANLIGYF